MKSQFAAGIAETFYRLPHNMKVECQKCLPEEMLEVLDRFEEHIAEND